MQPINLLIRNAELPGQGIRDLRINDGRIAAIAPKLERMTGERVIEAKGNALIRGLHDHHIHLFASAAARSSLNCGPPAIRDEVQLQKALARCPGTNEDWIRGVGFHESVCPQLDRRWLDAVCPERPVRIQHRSGMLWVLNTRALQSIRLEPHEPWPAGVGRDQAGNPDGRFLDLDQWLGDHLPRAWPSLGELSTELARLGVTGVTDAGARNGLAAWNALNAASEKGELVQRLLVMGNEDLDHAVATDGGRVEVGPLKIHVGESKLPSLEELTLRISAAHARCRAVAVHCVTRIELMFVLAAFEDAGSIVGDRIEHAAIADDHSIYDLARLGITVVTQPHFIIERGSEYLADVDPQDHALLYRGAAFLSHGVALAAGSDAPYGSIDPWAAMRAATQRRTRDGIIMGDSEALTPGQALELFNGNPRVPGCSRGPLAVGDVADLCLLHVPWKTKCADIDARHVAWSMCAGVLINADCV